MQGLRAYSEAPNAVGAGTLERCVVRQINDSVESAGANRACSKPFAPELSDPDSRMMDCIDHIPSSLSSEGCQGRACAPRSGSMQA